MSRLAAEHLMFSIHNGHSLEKALGYLGDDLSIERLKLPGIVVHPGPDGGVSGMPRADCLERHLPRNRKPTVEEMQHAWEACAAGA